MMALAVGGAMHVSIAGGDETPDWAYAGADDAFEVAPGGFLTLDRLALHGGVTVDGGSLTISRSTLDPALAVSASGGVVAFEGCAVDGAPLTVQVPTPWSGTVGQLAAALAGGEVELDVGDRHGAPHLGARRGRHQPAQRARRPGAQPAQRVRHAREDARRR